MSKRIEVSAPGRSFWSYRIVRRKDEWLDQHGVTYSFAVHEVFFDKNGKARACTTEPAFPMGESMEELNDDLIRYKAAFRFPAIRFEDIPEPGAIPFGEESAALSRQEPQR